jgi:hypothetical protein
MEIHSQLNGSYGKTVALWYVEVTDMDDLGLWAVLIIPVSAIASLVILAYAIIESHDRSYCRAQWPNAPAKGNPSQKREFIGQRYGDEPTFGSSVLAFGFVMLWG